MPKKKITIKSEGLGLEKISPVKTKNTQKKEFYSKKLLLQNPIETTENLEEQPEPDYEFKLPQEEVSFAEAPFWRRMAAYLIDCAFFYFLPFQIFMYIYLSKTGLMFSDVSALQEYVAYSSSAQIKLIAGFVAVLFVFLFYFVLAEKNFKTTIGKKVMGLKVSGKKMTYWTILLRNLTKTILFFAMPLDLIGIVFWKQKISDIISGTKVIYYMKLALSYGMY